MNRPTRQRNHVIDKLALKESRTPGKSGKKARRWKKAIEAHKPAAPAEG